MPLPAPPAFLPPWMTLTLALLAGTVLAQPAPAPAWQAWQAQQGRQAQQVQLAPEPATAAVDQFIQTALSLRNASDAAFQDAQAALAGIDPQDNATRQAYLDAVRRFYFVTEMGRNQTAERLPPPRGLPEEPAALLEQARQALLDSFDARLSLAAALAAPLAAPLAEGGGDEALAAQLLGRQAMATIAAHDLKFGLLTAEARELAGR